MSAVVIAAGIALALTPPGPTSLTLIVVLLVVSSALMYLMVRQHRWPVRVVSGVLVLALAMAAGVLEVNRYYGYYQSWSAMFNDLSGAPPDLGISAGQPRRGVDVGVIDSGSLQTLSLAGARSHITRDGLVYLPPQYDEPAYAHVRFPVVELLSGSPGAPVDWVSALRVIKVTNLLLARHAAGPMVLVMPAIMPARNGPYQECVNGHLGLDDTYLSTDVRNDILARFRVSRDPAEWGIGGYSSGGYCAANLALRQPSRYGAAAIMDGYFRAQDGPAAAAVGGSRSALKANSPLWLASRLRIGVGPVPAFWLSAGSGNNADFVSAKAFVAAMRPAEQTTFVIEPGAGHNFYAWASVTPAALAWLWQQLAPPDLRRDFPLSGPPTSIYVSPHLAPGHAPHSHRSPATTASR